MTTEYFLLRFSWLNTGHNTTASKNTRASGKLDPETVFLSSHDVTILMLAPDNRGVGVRAWQTGRRCHAEEDRERGAHKRKEKATYRGGSVEPWAAIGDSRTFLSGRPPVTQQWQEEFREGVTVVVWLQYGRMEEDEEEEEEGWGGEGEAKG